MHEIKKDLSDLKEHLKRMVNKASTMGWNTKQVHDAIDRIVDEHNKTIELAIEGINAEKEDIRQKIIEGINNQIKSIGMFPADTDCRKTCKEIIISELRNVRNIINKRFGVNK